MDMLSRQNKKQLKQFETKHLRYNEGSNCWKFQFIQTLFRDYLAFYYRYVGFMHEFIYVKGLRESVLGANFFVGYHHWFFPDSLMKGFFKRNDFLALLLFK